MPQMSWFPWHTEDVGTLWELFDSALKFADDSSSDSRANFIKWYDASIQCKGVNWNVTVGLYWIRPYFYLSLDGRNRQFLLQSKSHQIKIDNVSDLRQLPNAETYLKLNDICKKNLASGDSNVKNIPELSLSAWLETTSDKPERKTTGDKTATQSSDVGGEDRQERGKHYWIYSPGERGRLWEEFSQSEIMGIGWDELGDLSQYPDKETMRLKMMELYDETRSWKMGALATWQFVHKIREGDVVFAKRGMHEVVGRGVVESSYIFMPDRNEYRNIRKVKWTHTGSWQHPGQAVMKTLTDITNYTEYVQKLEMLVLDEDIETVVSSEMPISYAPYSESDFLEDVYLSHKQYETLVGLLKSKQNLILQGAPGVGKTYAAKRLAYSMIGAKDISRVTMIQFHQSYSYEDFIMGFRPTSDGFELKSGPFYSFCKEAEEDLDNDYFFIIDEFNRGNMDKIFGELLMLIERDKRGEKLRLLYSNEQFSVPKNVYIIGLMNTADRSLAMIDYALRRRFAFYEMTPAFDSDGFQGIIENADNKKFEALIECVKELNEAIGKDDSLGNGFKVGHSYFCANDEITDSWLEAVVNHELLPLLNEYWFDEKAKIELWSKKLRGALND
jgi:5-methylcytosine-specific restriction protein B